MQKETEYTELIETFINGNLSDFWQGIANYAKWELVALIRYWIENYKQSNQ